MAEGEKGEEAGMSHNNSFRSYEVDKNGMIISVPSLGYYREAGPPLIIRMIRYILGKIRLLFR